MYVQCSARVANLLILCANTVIDSEALHQRSLPFDFSKRVVRDTLFLSHNNVCTLNLYICEDMLHDYLVCVCNKHYPIFLIKMADINFVEESNLHSIF